MADNWEHFRLFYNLRKALPNIDIDNREIVDITYSQFYDYDTKVLKILSHYFKSKMSKVPNLKEDAQNINKLFPALSFEYILSQLEIFKDLPDRQEIVLRLIFDSKMPKSAGKVSDIIGAKRTSPINLESMEMPISPIKIRKLADGQLSSFSIVQEDQPILKSYGASVKKALPATITSSSEGSAYIGNDAFAQSSKIEMLTHVTSSYSINSKPSDSSSDKETKTVSFLHMPIIDTSEPQFHVTEEPSLSTVDNLILDDNSISVGREFEQNSIKTVANETNSKTHSSNVIKQGELLLSASVEQVPEENDTRNLDNSEQTESYVDDLDIDFDELDYMLMIGALNNPPKEKSTMEKKKSKSFQKPENPPIWDNNELPKLNEDQTPQASNKHLVDEPIKTSNSEDNLNVPLTVPPQVSNSENKTSYGNVLSTSKSLENADMNNKGVQDFDLIMYLQDITNCPEPFILRECNKLNINIRKKPSPPLLETLIDSLLTPKVSSDSSDEDVRYVPETYNVNRLQEEIQFANDLDRPSTSGMVPTNNKKSEGHNPLIEAPIDMHLVNHLCSIFPDACPNFVKGLCKGKAMNNEVLDEITTNILSTNDQYPKRQLPVVSAEPEVCPENQFEILKEFLPDADPDYLRMKCDQFEGKPELAKQFINEAMERRDYPTMKEYLRRQQLSSQEKQYTTEFRIENFMKVIPDPHTFFSDESRIIKMDSYASHYALVFLRNTFTKLPIRVIQSTFAKHNSHLNKTYKELEQLSACHANHMKSTRRPIDMPNSVQNIPLLQEIAYYTHQKEINNYLRDIKEKEEAEKQEALKQGLMKTCSCCYDEEVLPKNIFNCENGCIFCKDCIVKSSEVRFGEGKLDFPCLDNCSSSFSLQTLQAVLSPKLFSRIAQKKALEEIKSAGIDELETCPFCDFATIPAEGYNIFTCMNPECMKESCRLCKEPSHVPLHCDEIEKDEDVKARVFVENKMTEALLRKCWKCGVKFFKEEGCNKMTCSCGAQMCYVCGQPVKDYKHFNGQGGDRFDLCPLYSDTNKLNQENVLKGAEQAKSEIGNKALKIDPTLDLQQHYKERAKKLPPQPHMHNFVNVPDILAQAAAMFVERVGPGEIIVHRHDHRHRRQDRRHHPGRHL